MLGPDKSFLHSFLTLTVSSVLDLRLPGCISLPAGSLLEVMTECNLGNLVSSLLFLPKRPTLCVPFPTPGTSFPRDAAPPAQPLCRVP